MVNTILTDDERRAAINSTAYNFKADDIARAVEAAVLAKLAQQEPVAYVPEVQLKLLKKQGNQAVVLHDKPAACGLDAALYTHPAPQADRQRVPDGWKLVPVVPSNEMTSAMADVLDDPENDRSSWDLSENMYRAAMLAAAPEAPAQADRQRVPEGWKLVPVKPTIEMLSEGACAQSLPGPHYISGSAASQCWANMLAAAPEAPAQADDQLQDALDSLAFYKRRCDALQQAQTKMRDPERTMVCDILANGKLLEPSGNRYEAPAQASAVDDDYKGWYCAHCQRGVDAREVTFHEQHEACGRVITEDRPPKAQASAVDERAAFTVVYRNPTPEEVGQFMDHPKSVWFGWCHAAYQRDEARAALAQQALSDHDPLIEQSLAALIDLICPDLDSGDIVRDAQEAMRELNKRAAALAQKGD